MNEATPSPRPATPARQPQRRNWWRWFWLSFLVISLGYAWHCFYVPSNSMVWAEEYPSAQQQASRTGKPMILFFTAEWCVPCRIMKRQVWADKEVMASVHDRFIPVAIDVRSPNNARVLARYNVVGSPVTIITDPQGNALRWRVGGMSKQEFLEMIETSIEGPN